MSSANVSSFHSSSECSTAHISRRNLDADELDSNLYSATSTHPKASALSNDAGATSFDSEAFASPLSRPPTAVSASNAPTPATARGAQRLGSLRPPGIAVHSPSSLSASSASAGASSVGVTLAPGRASQSSPSKATQGPSHSQSRDEQQTAAAAAKASEDRSQHSSDHAKGRHFRHLLSVLHVAPAPAVVDPSASTAHPISSPTHEPVAAAAAAAAAPAAVSAPVTPVSSPAAIPPRRVAVSPTVPTSRGAAGEWMRRATDAKGGGDGSGGGDAPARALLLLPPLRPSPSRFAAGSKSGSSPASHRNGSSQVASPTSQLGAGTTTPLSSALAPPHNFPLPLSAVKVTEAYDGGWWAATRRYVASKSDTVNAYLERLVNPGAVDVATVSAQAAATQAHKRRASQLLQARSANASLVSGHTSRAASVSSGFDGAFDADRRAPPPRPPTSPSARPRRSIFEPFGTVPHHDSRHEPDSSGVPLDVVVIDPAQEPYVWNDPTIQAPEVRVEAPDAVNDSFNEVGDVSDSDNAEAELNTYVVDLLSALRGYLTTPTEPFGHLVAAALASRSAAFPVRGFEVAAAEHNPFLVRMIVDSGTLEVQDEEAQRNVQATVDDLIPATEGELSPGIYEYLSSFFKMAFVRLSHGQYALLKRSGFEYIKLMFDHQHVLPDEPFHSILVNESHAMHVINLVFMIVQLLSIIFCTVTFALVLASWMKMNNNMLQSYGFYTLIVFGGGWALYLVFIIYAVRGRQDEQRYEPANSDSDRLLLPSPYVAVVPVIPLFDVLCLCKYIVAVRKKRIVHGHNIVASSRLSGAFYAIYFAFPQLITQSYFNNIETKIEPQYRHRWAYTMLMVAVIVQWSIAIFGYITFLFTHDSIDGFGFACFNMARVPHLLERHNAVAHALHYLMAFLLETNVYLVAADSINRPGATTCASYANVVLALAAFSVFYILILYVAIVLSEASAVRISIACVFLLAVQVALCVCSERLERDACATYRSYFFRSTFVFGYLSWGAYFFIFVVWFIMMLQWCLLYLHQLNLFPRVLWPYARRDERFRRARRLEGSSTEPDAQTDGAAAEGKEDARTV